MVAGLPPTAVARNRARQGLGLAAQPGRAALQARAAAVSASVQGTALTPEALVGLTLSMPVTFNLQDYIDALVSTGQTNVAPTKGQGLTLSVPANGTLTYTVDVPDGTVWILGDDLSVSTNVTDSSLTLTATVDLVRVIVALFPLDRELYSVRLARFVAVTSGLTLTLVNGTSVPAEVNTVVSYVPLNSQVYLKVLVPIAEHLSNVTTAYGAAILAGSS